MLPQPAHGGAWVRERPCARPGAGEIRWGYCDAAWGKRRAGEADSFGLTVATLLVGFLEVIDPSLRICAQVFPRLHAQIGEDVANSVLPGSFYDAVEPGTLDLLGSGRVVGHRVLQIVGSILWMRMNGFVAHRVEDFRLFIGEGSLDG